MVAPRALLHPAVAQPAGSLLYELVTGHPTGSPASWSSPLNLIEELRAWPPDRSGLLTTELAAVAAAVVWCWQRGDLLGLDLSVAPGGHPGRASLCTRGQRWAPGGSTFRLTGRRAIPVPCTSAKPGSSRSPTVTPVTLTCACLSTLYRWATARMVRMVSSAAWNDLAVPARSLRSLGAEGPGTPYGVGARTGPPAVGLVTGLVIGTSREPPGRAGTERRWRRAFAKVSRDRDTRRAPGEHQVAQSSGAS